MTINKQTFQSNVRVDIVSDAEEKNISEPNQKIAVNNYKNLDLSKAWELANLIRIAGQDYNCFNSWFNETTDKPKTFILERNRDLKGIPGKSRCWIYVKKNIVNSTVDKYYVLSDDQLEVSDKEKYFPDSDYYKYEILKTYEFESYYPITLKVDIDRFGFIAERIENHKKIVFIVFRGTREPSEWFNNAQFQQIDFLMNNDNRVLTGCGKISMGFNKMYTQFRPGLLFSDKNNPEKELESFLTFNKDKFINKIAQQVNEASKDLTSKAMKVIDRANKVDIIEKPISKAISEFYSEHLAKSLSDNTSIYITGHSLGAALATIAAMDLVVTSNIDKDKNKNKESTDINKINLYTFASPRVGNNLFADKFNKFIDEQRIQAFRIMNSEDLVPNIPFSVWFKIGLDLKDLLALSVTRSLFNKITGGIFEKDYQHVGTSVCFTHQAKKEKGDSTATVGDNHNMTRTYCGALPNEREVK